MSRFGRVIKTAENLVPKAKQTAAELVQEGLEGAAKTAGKTKGKTKAVLAAENEELRKQIEELKKVGGQAASASTPSTLPASVRKSLGAPKLMREAQERKTATQFAKEGMPGRKLTMKEAEAKSEVVSRAGKRYREANKGADPDTDRYFSKEGLEGATEHTGSSHPDLKGAMKRSTTEEDIASGAKLRSYYRGKAGGQGAELPAHLVSAIKSGNPNQFMRAYDALSPKMQVFIDDHFMPHLEKIRKSLLEKGEKDPSIQRVMKEIAYKLGIATTAGFAATKGYKSASSEEA